MSVMKEVCEEQSITRTPNKFHPPHQPRGEDSSKKSNAKVFYL